MTLATLLLSCSEQGLHGTKDTNACPDVPTTAYTVPEVACAPRPEAAPIVDPWRARVLWTAEPWPEEEEEDEPMPAALAVAGVTRDTSGDGALGPEDAVMVVLGTATHVMAIDGPTGAALWTWRRASDLQGRPGVAIVDLDADGAAEIVTVDYGALVDPVAGIYGDLDLVVLDPTDGRELLRASYASTRGQGNAPVTVADVDADGYPEVLTTHRVLAGEGSVRVTLADADRAEINARDVDGDGVPELLQEGVVYTPVGAVAWEVDPIPGRPSTALLGMEAMAAPIVAWMDAMLVLTAPDGAVRYVSGDLRPVGNWASWAPCVGDPDGDGVQELAVPGPDVVVRMFEGDGTIAWEAPLEHPESWDGEVMGGCALADLDADGADEVLANSWGTFYVLDGRTGAVRVEVPNRSSGYLGPHPTVADVDGDGHAEILVPGIAPSPSLTVLTHDGAGWADLGRAWPVTDWTGFNVDAYGRVPAIDPPAWLLDGGWRRARLARDPGQPDLVPAMLGACGEDDFVLASVTNQGWAEAPAGALLVLEAEGSVVASTVLPAIGAARTLQDVVLPVPSESIRGEWTLRVDTEQVIEECDEGNNAVAGDG